MFFLYYIYKEVYINVLNAVFTFFVLKDDWLKIVESGFAKLFVIDDQTTPGRPSSPAAEDLFIYFKCFITFCGEKFMPCVSHLKFRNRKFGKKPLSFVKDFLNSFKKHLLFLYHMLFYHFFVMHYKE